MSFFSFGKKILIKYPFLISIASFIFWILGKNKIQYGGVFNHNKNIIKYKKAFLRHCKIKYIGKGNVVTLGEKCFLDNCNIYINGNNNKIIIDDIVCVHQGEFYIEDDNNTIKIGKKSLICGPAHFAAIEGTNIYIGKNCLISSKTEFRTGDSHSILNYQGERINPSRDITIMDRVWIGTRAICLKNALISSDSILAAASVLTQQIGTTNCILAGNPARIVKSNITWKAERI